MKWKKNHNYCQTDSTPRALTLSGPLLSNTIFTMAHSLVLKLLYISSLTTFKIPLCFVHSVTLLRRFMRAILKSNKPTEGGPIGQLFNLFYQIWLDLSFVVSQRLYMVTNKGRRYRPVIRYDFGEERSRRIVWLRHKWSEATGDSIEFHTIKRCCQQGAVYGAASEHSNKYKKQISHMVPKK